MSSYIHFTEEQKQRAAAVDLEEFLRCRGEKLLSSGREKRTRYQPMPPLKYPVPLELVCSNGICTDQSCGSVTLVHALSS